MRKLNVHRSWVTHSALSPGSPSEVVRNDHCDWLLADWTSLVGWTADVDGNWPCSGPQVCFQQHPLTKHRINNKQIKRFDTVNIVDVPGIGFSHWHALHSLTHCFGPLLHGNLLHYEEHHADTRPAQPHLQKRSQCRGTRPCLRSLRSDIGSWRHSVGPIRSGGDEGDCWSERCDFCSCLHGKTLDHTPHSASNHKIRLTNETYKLDKAP